MTLPQTLADRIRASGVDTVRFAWCDTHGDLRCKTLTAQAALGAEASGVGLVSTLTLKDTADRTAFKVFEPNGQTSWPSLTGLMGGNNLLLKPDPGTFRVLPWPMPAEGAVGWVLCQAFSAEQYAQGAPLFLDTRAVLQQAVAQLADRGFAMRCGLEVEFHIYRRVDDLEDPATDPIQADWPGPAPSVDASGAALPAADRMHPPSEHRLRLLHPGYQLLSESYTDRAAEALAIVRHTAQQLGMPLVSVEVEFGPSQVEAVFEPTDALAAADNMVLFRSAVRQALWRAGYHASFACRPPFPNIMSSGWHLHHSLTTGKANAFSPTSPDEALSTIGRHWLAGLLRHAAANTLFACPTINGFARFRPNALAPQAIVWGRDNRGAMLRVISASPSQPGHPASRIENRAGEPLANPYLFMASQIHAGLLGLGAAEEPPPPTDDPYSPAAALLPNSIPLALAALEADPALAARFPPGFLDVYAQIKRQEQSRFEAASDKDAWMAREYFGRY
jgi:glutamine synthetase